MRIGAIKQHMLMRGAVLIVATALFSATLVVTLAPADPSHATSSVTPARPANNASVARVISLHEYATLRVTKNSGSNLDGEGTASGTLRGSLSLRIVVDSAERMSASFFGRGRPGTLSGQGVSRYQVSGNNLRYTGTVRISRGTGTYAHASGSGIHIEGTMNRQRKTITMTISGQMHV
jgi:hypothetical protein